VLGLCCVLILCFRFDPSSVQIFIEGRIEAEMSKDRGRTGSERTVEEDKQKGEEQVGSVEREREKQDELPIFGLMQDPARINLTGLGGSEFTDK
jgi:hypothetical protein